MSGSPKVYPPTLVEQVRTLYGGGASQTEVGQVLGVSQKVVWRLMLRHGIPTRPAVKRNQTGPANSSWQGEDATYSALHHRVEVLRGKPSECSRCNTKDPTKRYEWANINGRYDDPDDYERLCVSCHRRFDNKRRHEGVSPPCPPRRASV